MEKLVLDDATKADLQARFPSDNLQEITAETDDGAVFTIICKSPPAAEWKRWRAMILDADQRALAGSTLLGACRVWPDDIRFADMLKDRPGLTETFAGQLIDLAGVTKKVSAKKL